MTQALPEQTSIAVPEGGHVAAEQLVGPQPYVGSSTETQLLPHIFVPAGQDPTTQEPARHIMVAPPMLVHGWHELEPQP